MPHYTFKERRTGKLKTIGAGDAMSALKALTIYPWAFRIVDVRGVGERLPITDAECRLPDPHVIARLDRYSQQELLIAEERAAKWKEEMGFK